MDARAITSNTFMGNHRLPAFRLGDVRGRYPTDINEDFAYRFALAFAARFGIRQTVAIGHDMRDSSPSLQQALTEGFLDLGINVLNLGLCCTELGYFASVQAGIEAVFIVTASHNPARYNGFKCVLSNGEAVSYSSGLADVEQRMISGNLPKGNCKKGSVQDWQLISTYLEFINSMFDFSALPVPRTALNGLNGMAATLATGIIGKFSLPVSWFRKEPGQIPEEGADPAKPELIAEMNSFMTYDHFDLGVSWDGDGDRCMFFNRHGDLVPTYYVIGMLADYHLDMQPGGAIVYDNQLCWNTLDIIKRHQGKAVRSQAGHAFFKMNMQNSSAIYGGELSSHHYFGNFYGCDSGMIAWLSVLKIISSKNVCIEELVAEAQVRFCAVPEINLKITDVRGAFSEVKRRFSSRCTHVDTLDGDSYEFGDRWRFSLRQSKTEPLVRLNIESRCGQDLLLESKSELLDLLKPYCHEAVDLAEKPNYS